MSSPSVSYLVTTRPGANTDIAALFMGLFMLFILFCVHYVLIGRVNAPERINSPSIPYSSTCYYPAWCCRKYHRLIYGFIMTFIYRVFIYGFIGCVSPPEMMSQPSCYYPALHGHLYQHLYEFILLFHCVYMCNRMYKCPDQTVKDRQRGSILYQSLSLS